MSALYLILAIWAAVLVLAAGDILLRTFVSDETLERWTDRIFR